MMVGGVAAYRDVFGNRSFRRFWFGFAFSSLGDAMTRVALIWYVWDATESARALALLSLLYTGPVVVGGLVAGALLDRFDRRAVMLVDNAVRGLAIGLIPLLHALGRLELWHVYAVAAVYGSLMMISLAGGPALLPSIVRHDQLVTVNALEMLSYTLGGMVGPPLAGLLIASAGAPNVLLLDAVSYAAYALALAGVRYLDAPPKAGSAPAYTLSDAVRLLLGNRLLMSTTVMYMCFNIGQGFLFVALPILAERFLDGGPQLYGALLGCLAAGQVCSSLLAGSATPRLPLGTLICCSQLLSGASIALLLIQSPYAAALGLLLHGFFTAPLTIWAQTLRMEVIPAPLRGRTFALLRMLMQGAGPIGSALAGIFLPLLGVRIMIALASAIAGSPGVAGYQVSELRNAGQPVEPIDEVQMAAG
jgi:MFS family permease